MHAGKSGLTKLSTIKIAQNLGLEFCMCRLLRIGIGSRVKTLYNQEDQPFLLKNNEMCFKNTAKNDENWVQFVRVTDFQLILLYKSEPQLQ